MTLRELCCRLLGIPRRRHPDEELQDEFASHLEFAEADYLQQGMSAEDARNLARKRFGSVAAAKEIVWEQRRLPGIGEVAQDARYALRGMRKSPAFALTAIATLGLGIGLCVSMYTGLSAMFLRPLPGVPQPDRLATMRDAVPYARFESYRDHGNGAWTAAAFMGPLPFNLAQSDRVEGLAVSPEYFVTLRVQPMLGRFFDPKRDKAGSPPAAIVTEHFWRTRLNADPHPIGRTLRVNGRVLPIIGVSAPGFYGAGTGAFTTPEIFIAATSEPKIAPELRTAQPVFRVLFRLDPGVAITGAEARLEGETRALAKDDEPKGRLVRLDPAGTLLPLPKEARATIIVFYAVLMSAIVALMCANLGGLILARGVARGREFAIRLSIGAGRFRLMRQLLTESALLAAAGGLAGFVAAGAILRLLRRIQSVSNPLVDNLVSGPDVGAALFTIAIAAITAAGFGLLPAFAITRQDPMKVAKGEQGRANRRRYRRLGLRNVFVVCQVGAAMMLALIIGFLVIGARYGSRTTPGFDPGPITFFSVDPERDGLSPAQAADALQMMPARLAQVAGVEGVSVTDRPPLSSTYPDTVISTPSHNTRVVVFQSVGPGFFKTLGARILRGADFQQQETTTEHSSAKILPVAINQTAATELFGNEDPLGGRLQQDEQILQVAAVVRYAPRATLMGRPIPIVFAPYITRAGENTVLVRARGQLGIAAMRRQLAAIDPRITLFHPQSLRAYVVESDRMGSKIAAFYLPVGLFGLVLGCIGLAGVTANNVQRRTNEIGIRMALGARRSQVLRLVMGEGAVMTAIGAALGYAAAFAFLRILTAVSAPMAQVLGPVASNPALTVGVPMLLIALAALACWTPARRSASIDPAITLREE